jgi:hypothetical protein
MYCHNFADRNFSRTLDESAFCSDINPRAVVRFIVQIHYIHKRAPGKRNDALRKNLTIRR